MSENKKKVGIITYHEPISYGANLQCLGLQMYLEEINCNPEIIDYSSAAYLELRSKYKIKTLIKRTLNFLKSPIAFLKAKLNANKIAKQKINFKKELKNRDNKFYDFQKKYYRLSKRKYKNYSEIKNNCPEYDAYICGSDQIWNPNFCDMDDNYFLTFAPKNKRIAYAPSFGVKKIPFYAKKEYKKRLNDIETISIREESGAKIIKDLTGKNVPIVIDPTFLVNKTKWIEISNNSDITLPKEYILTYFIGIDDYTEKYIDEVKRSFPEFEIINLVFDQTSYGPCDFIKLISKAKFIFTNSFHGLAFAINLNIPFIVGKTLKDYGKNSGFSRIEDLLNRLDLTERIYDGSKKLNKEYLSLDYSKVNKKIEQIVDDSKVYLKKALNIK